MLSRGSLLRAPLSRGASRAFSLGDPAQEMDFVEPEHKENEDFQPQHVNSRYAFHSYVKSMDQFHIREVVHIGRHQKAMKGGRQLSFSALVLIGNGSGTGGVGYGKALKVMDAIQNANIDAEKNVVHIDRFENCRILRTWDYKRRGTTIHVRALPKGAGVKGGAVSTLVADAFGLDSMAIKVRGPRSKSQSARLKTMVEALRFQPNPYRKSLVAGRRMYDTNKVWRRRDITEHY